MTESSATAPAAPPPESESAVKDEPTLTTRSNGEAITYATLSPEDILAIENLVTEDDTPVDNSFSEQQRRLLARALRVSWQGPGDGRPFMVAADVGVFRTPGEPPLVPDVFLSLDVVRPEDIWSKEGRSYFIWHYEKPPDVVIEVVSNTEGGETDVKMERYAHFGVPYYVIFDPLEQVQAGMLRAYELSATGVYVERSPDFLPAVALGLRLWRGVFEGHEETWLRWYDAAGALILTGEENTGLERARAEQERRKAEQEKIRAEREKSRAEQAESMAEQERSRADQLAALLRAHGISPENGDP
jgi:Uma2 family endonuclease